MQDRSGQGGGQVKPSQVEPGLVEEGEDYDYALVEYSMVRCLSECLRIERISARRLVPCAKPIGTSSPPPWST